MTRAKASGVSLSEADAAVAKGMLKRGDRQHDVAAWFGVNGGRIAELANGTRFSHVVPAAFGDLPPPGPYPAAKQSLAAVKALQAARQALAQAEAALKNQQGKQ